MPPLNSIISPLGKLPHYPQNEHGFPKGSPTPWRMGRGFSRGNWCVSFPLNDSLLLSVRTERREKIKSKEIDPSVSLRLPAPFTQGSLFNRSFLCCDKRFLLCRQTLFLWHQKRKEKALQKETRIRDFAVCGRRQGLRALDGANF